MGVQCCAVITSTNKLLQLKTMFKFKLSITLFAIIIAIAPAKAAHGFDDYKGNEDALEKWQNINDVLKEGLKSLTKSVLPFAVRITNGLNISTSCIRDGLHVFNGIRKLDPIATRFVDSSGKMIDGIAVGTLSTTGVFDECLDTEVFNNNKNGKTNLLYRGQYCTMKLSPALPEENKVFKTREVVEDFANVTKSETIKTELAKSAQMIYLVSLRVGICVPSGCTKNDINQIVHAIGNSFYIDANITHCEVKESNKYYPLHITVIFIYSATAFLVLIGSLLDIKIKKSTGHGRLVRCLLQFSFFKNYSKFTKLEDQNEHLRCLNGMRFISLCWITLTHTCVLINFYNLKYTVRAVDFVQDFGFQAIVNAFHIADTFFVIGGAVSCYVVITYVKTKGRPFSIPMHILNRLGRILPVYIYLVLFMFLLDLLGSGPFWNDFATPQIQNCYDKWWYNFLFINNFLEAESMCVHHTWYLACDLQFYIAAIFILLPLIKKPKVGVSVCAFVIISSAISCGLLTYFEDYPPTGIVNGPNFMKTREYFNYYFIRPYPHIAPYFIGLLLGYVLAVKPTFKIPKKIQLLCWVLAFVSSFSVVFGSLDWNRGKDPTVAETISYASLSRLAWALSVAWLIFSCATGHGGYINRFLSWKGFVPLGRLSFVAYLVHPIVITMYISCLQTRMQVSHFYWIWLYFGHLSITFIISFFASMFIEAPFLSLTKMLISRENGAKSSGTTNAMKTYPIQSIHFYCDAKPDIEKRNDTNGDTNKAYTEESVSNGIITNGSVNECKEHRIKLSEIISENNFYNNVSIDENIELEDVKVDDNQNTADEIETNESIAEIIVKQENIEEDRITGDVQRNVIDNEKNQNEISTKQKEVQAIDTDVKATFFPGLGWKLLT